MTGLVIERRFLRRKKNRSMNLRLRWAIQAQAEAVDESPISVARFVNASS